MHLHENLRGGACYTINTIIITTTTTTTTVTKSRYMRWAGHLVRMREIRNAYIISVGKPERKRSPGRTSVGEKVTLELILGK
jgi:hypothetical protein